MASIKKIKKHNPQKFLDDLKRVRDILVMPQYSKVYLHVKKRELLEQAEHQEIHYYITDKIYVVVRDVMIII